MSATRVEIAVATVVRRATIVAERVSTSVVATLVAVVHSEVLVARPSDGCERATVIPRATAISVPSVSTAINRVEARHSEVEVGAVRIAGIDAEVPVATAPVQRTIEISGVEVHSVLPVEEDIAQVEIAALPVDAVKVVLRVYAHEVVEVHLVGCFILLFREVELIGHLVGEEQGLLAGLLVAHGVGRCYECEQCHKGGHHLLHNRNLFKN